MESPEEQPGVLAGAVPWSPVATMDTCVGVGSVGTPALGPVSACRGCRCRECQKCNEQIEGRHGHAHPASHAGMERKGRLLLVCWLHEPVSSAVAAASQQPVPKGEAQQQRRNGCWFLSSYRLSRSQAGCR